MERGQGREGDFRPSPRGGTSSGDVGILPDREKALLDGRKTGSASSTLDMNLALGFTSLGSWRRQWQPTPVLLPGKSHGQRSLVGCSPWGR